MHDVLTNTIMHEMTCVDTCHEMTCVDTHHKMNTLLYNICHEGEGDGWEEKLEGMYASIHIMLLHIT